MENERLNQEYRDAWPYSTPACQPGSVAQRPVDGQSPHRTVADSLVLFLNERRSRNLTPDTITKYDQMLHRVLEPVLGRLCVDVTTEDVRGLINALQGLSPDTVNGYIRSLKCWANFCIEEHIATALEPKRLRPLRTPKRIPPHLTEEEMIGLLEAFSSRASVVLWTASLNASSLGAFSPIHVRR